MVPALPTNRNRVFAPSPKSLLAANRRGLAFQPAGADAQIEFQRRVRLGPCVHRLSPDADVAVMEPPVERTERLPFEPVGGKAISVPLADRVAAQVLTPVQRVALAARQVQLTTAGVEVGFANSKVLGLWV